MEIRIKLAKTSDNPMRALRLIKFKCDRYNIFGKWRVGHIGLGNGTSEQYFIFKTDEGLDEMHRRLLYAFIDFVIQSNPSLKDWETAEVSDD